MKLCAVSLVCLNFGQSAHAQDCKTIVDTTLRLACYDGHFGKPVEPAKATAPAKEESRWAQVLKELKLADESTPKGLGSDPASISWARRDGEEYSSIKAAGVWEAMYSPFPPESTLARYGWGPVASFSLNRNTLTTKRADTRQIAVGMSGTIFDIDQMGFALYSKVSYTFRKNKVDDTRSDLVSIDDMVVTDVFRSGIPYQSPFARYFLPRFGLVYEDVKQAKAGDPTGTRGSAFIAAKYEVYPAFISDRLKGSLYVQRFVDLTAGDGLTKRRETYGKATIEYLLYPPQESPTAQPSLAIERTIGADLLGGVPRAGETKLLLKVKIN